MRRLVDRGAVTAAWVGVGMAVTIAISFLLVIPIEFLYVPVSPVLAGLLIGYYANARSGRAGGPAGRQFANGLFAGLATGVTFALLLLGVKALFFAADSGYRDASAGGRITCTAGADCVYRRHLAYYGEEALLEAGVTDAASFSAYYWNGQLSSAGLAVALTAGTALAGAAIYGASNRRRPGEAARA